MCDHLLSKDLAAGCYRYNCRFQNQNFGSCDYEEQQVVVQNLANMRDFGGQVLFSEGMLDQEGADGVSLVLTLDLTIQEIAQRELERAVKDSEASGGMVLVMDPKTSDVLAMANVPNFNPNTFWKFKPRDYRNRTVTDCFEPGSTMKVFTVGSALQQSAVKPDELID